MGSFQCPVSSAKVRQRDIGDVANCRICLYFIKARGGAIGRSHQLRELVVGFESPQEAAELMVVLMVGEPLLRPQDVSSASHQMVQKLGSLHFVCEQRPPHRCQPNLQKASHCLNSKMPLEEDGIGVILVPHCCQKHNKDEGQTVQLRCLGIPCAINDHILMGE